MVMSLFLAVIKPDLIGEIMLGGAMIMVLTKLLSMEQAYRAVEWRSIFLIAGMLPLGIAIEKSGLAAYLFNVLITYLGSISPLALLMGMVILSILFTQIMHGAAVAVIMVPIAIHIAQRLGIDPRSLAMGVTLATSMAFLTPLGHPVNVLVMGPGGYKFRDYLKVGLPLTGILLVIILLLLPVFWPLVPK
jgi:di/tricarboxylate transporter